MNDLTEAIATIRRLFRIDLDDPMVRERAWRRILLFRNLADQLERDGNRQMAQTLRRIYHHALSSDKDEHALLCLAMLAGLGEDHERLT